MEGYYYGPQRLRVAQGRRLEELDVEGRGVHHRLGSSRGSPGSMSMGQCDCTSYSYFALSLALFGVGTVITVLALGDAHGRMFASLGHMWLVGPIFISSGLMIAVKSVIYLRKKSLLQMIVRQRALIRDLQELARQSRNQACMMRNASAMTLPPSYDSVVGPQVGDGEGVSGGGGGSGGGGAGGGEEAPPPTYEEAVFLLGEEKWKLVLQTKSDPRCGEESKSEPSMCTKPAP